MYIETLESRFKDAYPSLNHNWIAYNVKGVIEVLLAEQYEISLEESDAYSIELAAPILISPHLTLMLNTISMKYDVDVRYEGRTDHTSWRVKASTFDRIEQVTIRRRSQH